MASPVTKGIVFDIKKYSIHDGPGIRTTVFLKGCSLHCWWCHNPESRSVTGELILREERCIGCGECLKACPHDAIVVSEKGLITSRERCRACGTCAAVCPAEAREIIGREMTVGEVMNEIEKDVIFYDQSGGGATFSGGEPQMQPEFLGALLDACRKKEIHTVVDTTGYAATGTVLNIAEKTDLFLYDLKHMDPEKHLLHTGVSNELILQNLRVLAESGVRVIVRIPLIPGVNDDDGNISRTASFISSLPGVNTVNILPYHGAGREKSRRLGMCYRLPDQKAPSIDRTQEIAQSLSAQGLDVKIGG
jgi:pyruvate formate lyase activating enzyme